MKPYDVFRFLQNVDNKIDQPDECWEWMGRTTRGYGILTLNRINTLAHRIAYELKYGVFDNNLKVCHKCDNPLCCNPFHLFLGTNKDNTDDMFAKGRNASRIGGLNGNSKLTEKEALDIKYGNKTVSDLCKEYNIRNHIVYSIRSGTRWKHI